MSGRPISGARAAGGLAALTVLAVTALVVLLVLGARAPARVDSGAVDFSPDHLSAELAGHYRYASAHGEHLRGIPCYCGCEEFLAHRSLEDCFVTPEGEWEPHAAGCGVCIGEVALVRTTIEGGGTAADARDVVIATFGSTPVTAPPDSHEETSRGT